MAKASTRSKKMMASTYCRDCIKNKDKCDMDPLECRKDEDADLYFKLYDKSDANFCRM